MNLNQIDTKNFIMALFKRDDGERFLLGTGLYEFKDGLQHFQPNIIANDVVEKQGANGQLLAGQVARSASQPFTGYIGDNTTTRSATELARRQFFRFFQPNYFYTVIYILPTGEAIQRKNGYLTEAPSVPEMIERFPEYRVALAFEDLNYYTYDEDNAGNEIYAQVYQLEPESQLTGGLVWNETTGLTINQIEGDTEQAGTPTPTSPQDIKVVSGDQIVMINGVGYDLALGSVELCEIGTAKDYIWNDNGTWKIHKATGSRVFNGTDTDLSASGWFNSSETTTTLQVAALDIKNLGAKYTARANSLMTHFVYLSDNSSPSNGKFKLVNNTSGNVNHIRLALNKTIAADLAAAKTWIATNLPTIYFEKTTATDSVITNATLLKNLNAINAALHSTTETPTVAALYSTSLPAIITTTNFTTTDGIVWTNQGHGKNILNLTAGLVASNQATRAVIGDKLIVDGTNDNNHYDYVQYELRVEPAKTIAISIGDLTSDRGAIASTERILLIQARQGGSWIQVLEMKESSHTATYTVPSGVNRIRVAFYGPYGATFTYSQVMIEEAAAPTTYEPFTPTGGAVWDAETGHATTTMTVGGLFPVSPVWIVAGPAESPLIENLTDNTSLSYLGTIAAGQSLVVDCGAQTATLAGANVKNNIRGTWQKFDPGQVTIRYSGANVTGPSTIQWNEVVE